MTGARQSRTVFGRTRNSRIPSHCIVQNRFLRVIKLPSINIVCLPVPPESIGLTHTYTHTHSPGHREISAVIAIPKQKIIRPQGIRDGMVRFPLWSLRVAFQLTPPSLCSCLCYQSFDHTSNRRRVTSNWAINTVADHCCCLSNIRFRVWLSSPDNNYC